VSKLPLSKTDYADNIYWVYGILLEENNELDAEAAMKRLAEKGHWYTPLFLPLCISNLC
jgi:perosamine synthetase